MTPNKNVLQLYQQTKSKQFHSNKELALGWIHWISMSVVSYMELFNHDTKKNDFNDFGVKY